MDTSEGWPLPSTKPALFVETSPKGPPTRRCLLSKSYSIMVWKYHRMTESHSVANHKRRFIGSLMPRRHITNFHRLLFSLGCLVPTSVTLISAKRVHSIYQVCLGNTTVKRRNRLSSPALQNHLSPLHSMSLLGNNLAPFMVRSIPLFNLGNAANIRERGLLCHYPQSTKRTIYHRLRYINRCLFGYLVISCQLKKKRRRRKMNHLSVLMTLTSFRAK